MSYYGKSKGWTVFLKIVFILAIYVFGVFSADWWMAKYYNTRIVLANKISPEGVVVTGDSIIQNVSSKKEITTKASCGNSCNKNQSICIPFTEKNGIKYVTIKFDSLKITGIYDTGCSVPVAFCPKDYYKLVGAGVIEEDKFSNTSYGVTASGSHIGQNHFNIPKMQIGNIFFENQEVSVLQSGNNTLIGNTLWKDYKSYVVDNENHCIVFTK